MSDELHDALRVHRANLDKLELQRAKHGLQVPLDILNSIEAERIEIQRIEQELEYRRQAAQEPLRPVVETDFMPEQPIPQYANNIVAKIDRLSDKVGELTTRVALNDERMAKMQEDFLTLRTEVHALHSTPEPIFSRTVLYGGGLIAIVILAVMVFLSIRVVQL